MKWAFHWGIYTQMTAIGWGMERLGTRASSGNLKKVIMSYTMMDLKNNKSGLLITGSSEEDFEKQLSEEDVILHQHKEKSA